ncbi:MAG: ATP-binding cassette domain-containing protein [Myxococcaceae bacterium]|nr:ATP-binding cassette domain-containing protein [Myxococcaceae bacterium]
MSAPAIRFSGVSKAYGGAPPVLRRVDVEVPDSGVTFVVGRSGAGKSVFCRLAVGLERPDEGEVLLMGTPLSGLSERRLLELRRDAPYLVQGPALLDWLTLSENVALADPQRDRARALSALERVGLTNEADRLPTEVGPGVRKRAAIARALVLGPRYLLFDEPTTGLDHKSARQVSEVLERLRAEGLGALVVSHDYPLLERIADRVILVEGGQARVFPSKDAFWTSDDPAVRELLAPVRAESFDG